MGQENKQRNDASESKQGGTIDDQPGGAGGGTVWESPGFEEAGREPRDPELIGKPEGSWRPTDDPIGERPDGESGVSGTGSARERE